MICTSIEQSKILIKLGIDVNTADMYWSMDEIPYLPFPVNDIVTDWEYGQENGMLPAWSLSALLELMPDIIHIDSDNDGYLRLNKTSVWYVDDYKDVPISFNSKPIDAAFEMVCWLLENKKL